MTTPTTIDTAIYAKWILPIAPKNRVYTDCGLAIDEGNIIGIWPKAELQKQFLAKEVVQLDRHLLMPGLVNAHGHAAMSLLRGYADDLPLMEWLQKHIWPAEQRWIDENFVSDGSELAIAEMLRSGTTCFSDMYFYPEAAAHTAHRSGIRAQICFPILDFPTNWGSGPDEYIHKGLELHDTYRSHPLIHTAFGPHAPYTVSDEPLSRIAMLCDELQAPMQIHLHETAYEVESAVKESGSRPIARLAELGALNPLSQCVHMTQVNDEDIDTILQDGANIVHCPKSNLKLASGLCPVQSLRKKGINIGLGTDGAASNNSLDMFSEMQSAAMLAKFAAQDASALNATEALEMATLGGAKVLGLDDRIGTLEKGKSADIIAVELDDLEHLPHYDLASTLVYTQCAHKVSHAWVQGQVLLNDRSLTRIDEKTLKIKVLEWQNKLSEAKNI